MKKTMISVLIFCLASLGSAAGDLTLEQVLNQYYEANGGLEAIRKVQSVKFTGTATIPMQSIDLPMSFSYKEPGLLRIEAEFNGMKILLVSPEERLKVGGRRIEFRPLTTPEAWDFRPPVRCFEGRGGYLPAFDGHLFPLG